MTNDGFRFQLGLALHAMRKSAQSGKNSATRQRS